MKPVRRMIKALLLGAGTYLCWFLLPNLLYLAGVLLFPQYRDVILEYLGIFGTALSALAVMTVFALFGRRFRETTFWKPRRVSALAHLGAAAFGVCTNTTVSVLLTLLPLPESLVEEYAQQSQGLYNPAHAVLSLLSVVVLAPVFEEILFRGYLFRFFREGFSFWTAAVASSLLFGIAHGQLLWICYAAGMGLLFCIISERSGTLTLSVAAHVGFNLTAVPQMLLPDLSRSVAGLLASGAVTSFLAVLIWKTLLFPKDSREE